MNPGIVFLLLVLGRGLRRPSLGIYYGEMNPVVFLAVEILDDSLASFSMYLSGFHDPDGARTPAKLLFRLPRLEFSLQDSVGGETFLSFNSSASPVGDMLELGVPNSQQALQSVDSMYALVKSKLPRSIHPRLTNDLGGSVTSPSQLLLMKLFTVKLQQGPVDWKFIVENSAIAENRIVTEAESLFLHRGAPVVVAAGNAPVANGVMRVVPAATVLVCCLTVALL